MNKRHCQLLLALLLTACSAVEPPAPAGDAAERGAAGGVVRVVAAGDIADCGTAPAASSMASQTAGLVSAADAAVLTLGDHVYPDGAPDEFARCFDPTWGRFRQRQRPSPGNHDYRTPGAAGYYAYFGDLAGPDRRGYYSFDLGHWHFISLNSAVDAGPGSAQLRWLVEDLKASAGARCTLAYWHHPVFSSGPHGNDARMKDVYAALYAAGADIVLSGHDHVYERFAPLDASGTPDPLRGIRSFTVGTGGARLYRFKAPHPASEYRDASTHGVLRLTLGDGWYMWEFQPVGGGPARDRAMAACHR